jgi:hypothetical protein
MPAPSQQHQPQRTHIQLKHQLRFEGLVAIALARYWSRNPTKNHFVKKTSPSLVKARMGKTRREGRLWCRPRTRRPCYLWQDSEKEVLKWAGRGRRKKDLLVCVKTNLNLKAQTHKTNLDLKVVINECVQLRSVRSLRITSVCNAPYTITKEQGEN